MSHYFTLRFDSEAEALATAEALRLLPEDDEMPDLLVVSQGTLFGQAQLISDVTVPGTYDPETGEELSPPIPVPGVFLNVVLNRAALPYDLRRRRVPYGCAGQVWAGTEPEPGAWPPMLNNEAELA